MQTETLRTLISKREGITTEFKEARNALPTSTFETICAFLNRAGGDLLLGVGDNGQIVGVNPNHLEKIMNDLVNLSNNPNKIDPPFMLFPQEIELEGKSIIYVRVPQSSQVHRTGNCVYDRSVEGDFKVTTHAALSRLFERKSAFFTENKIYPFLGFTDFNHALFAKVRNLIQSHRPDHPWLSLSNDDLLKSAGLFRRDFETGQEGYTLAAALLFGKDDVIRQILPFYKTDALVKKTNLDRYDDRKDIRTNLVDAYDEMMRFIRTHLPDRFFMEGDIRVDLREKIFREIVSNLLIHREFTNAFPASLIVYHETLSTENASIPARTGHIDPETFHPHPKNPVIAKFFQQLGRAEELGSGIRNISKYLRYYAPGTVAEFIEGDIFKTVIPLVATRNDAVKLREEIARYGNDAVSDRNDAVSDRNDAVSDRNDAVSDRNDAVRNETVKLRYANQIIEDAFGTRLAAKVKQRLTVELKHILQRGGIGHQEIRTLTGVGRATAQRDMKLLTEKDIVRFAGAPKTGKYVLKQQVKQWMNYPAT